MAPLIPGTFVRISGRRTALGNAPEPSWTGRIIHAYPDIQEYLVQPDAPDSLPVQVGQQHVKQR